MTAIKIEKNVPIPQSKRGRRSGYPFADMEPGDSFFAPAKTDVEFKRVRGAVAMQQRKTGAKFKTRAVDGGIRVWLVSRMPVPTLEAA